MLFYQMYFMTTAALYQYGRGNQWHHIILGVSVFSGLARCGLGNLGKPIACLLLDAARLLPRYISFGLELSLITKSL